MSTKNQQPQQTTTKDELLSVRTLIPYLYIWGIQWIVSAILEYGWFLEPRNWLQTLSTGIAILLSLVVFVRQSIKGRSQAFSKQPIAAMWLPLFVMIGSIYLLHEVGAIDPHFLHLFRALILAFYLVHFGVLWAKPFVYLGLWLFALTTVLSIWYLGYAPMVVSFFGGISLLSAALLLQLLTWPLKPISTP